MANIVFYRQKYGNHCGPACLRIILSYFGFYIQEWTILERKACPIDGWSISDFTQAALAFNIKCIPQKINAFQLSTNSLPFVILHDGHYVVLYQIKKGKIYIADPKTGKITYNKREFISRFIKDDECIILNISTISGFKANGKRYNSILALKTIGKYFIPHKRYIYRLIGIILMVSLAQITIPFISKAIIDKGLGTSSWDFIELMIIANVILVLANVIGSFTQTYILTHVTNRVKVVMLDDYMIKMLSLPFSYFMRTSLGDMIQRVKDNERIQSYFISTFFSSLVSLLFLLLFSCILLYFSTILFVVYFASTAIYILWTCIFLRQRKKLDLRFWELLSQNNKCIIEVATHVTDIKGFNYDEKFSNRWRDNIIEQHRQNISYLYFSQIQEVGANIIMQGKDIALTFISCYYILNGDMTLGTLFAVQYILGNLNAPLYKLSDFFNQTQLASISLSRIFDYNQQPDEINNERSGNTFFPLSRDYSLSNVSYRYPDGTIGLRNLSLKIQYGKKIAIVGTSGCGKSTLLKIISGLIIPNSGDYLIGTTNTQSIDLGIIRKHISCLLQENSLFDGSLLENIVDSTFDYDETRMIKSVETACIRNEIETLPEAYHTMVGSENRQMSRGQMQRILLARTLYKKADIYLFDELANSLGLAMEKKIVSKIDSWFSDKTRIYVTHRGDSIKDADLILVMNNGIIVDFGQHNDLIQKQSYYSSLFTNQIETNFA